MDKDKFFQRLTERMDNAGDSIKKRVLHQAHNALVQELQNEENVEVELRGDDALAVTQEGREEGAPLDLKPFFRRSPKANRKRKGGWYLIVPIRRYTRGASKASGMSRRMYDELRSAPAPNNRTIISDYLYNNRSQSPIPELNYEPKSRTITRMENPSGRGNVYISFRTVSDTSAPNSWILNRANARLDNLTPRIQNVIQEVKRQNLN